ncbi:MAG: sugar phosphate isomerase/epimerase [Acidobacteriota bacterium]|nr:sugar phosphate isomerase/epimerase [Acidobacteriota bacterium]
MSYTSNLSRRQLLALAAAAPLLGAASKRIIGVQLYTVRGTLMKDSDHVLQTIADIGYKEIEGQGRADLIALAPKIKDLGMKSVSCHVETPLITGDWDKYKGMKEAPLEEAIESLKKIDVEYFTMAYIQPQARGADLDFYRKTADQMNHAAEMCQKAGLKFAYHNHAFEFAGAKGQRPIDIFHERLDKKLVNLELDVFWASVAGNDPVEMLKTWKGQVGLLHLKDKAKDMPVQYKEGADKSAFKEVGSGGLDFPAILKAAPPAGVKHYFVEQDQTPGDPLDSLRKSFEYLQTV